MDLVLRFMGMFMFVSIITLHNVKANIGHYDDHWKQREEQAKWNAAKAYNPDPHKVANNLNEQVRRIDISVLPSGLTDGNPILSYDSNDREEVRNAYIEKRLYQPRDRAFPQTIWSGYTRRFNESWHLEGIKSSRRHLHTKYKGPCVASNPIDQCWRCDPNWAKNRQKLADCVLGFGHKTTGGKNGKIYVVTDNSDNDLVNPKPGTLRHAVIQDEPLWIIFKHGMKIRLSEELLISSNKTIDGRGGHVHITGGAGIMMQYVDNVIIHSIHIHDIKNGNGGMIRDSVNHFGFRTASDGDGISIFGTTNVWIDHVSMSKCMDGLIDAIEASTAITISNCHFTDHNDVLLFGASDGAKQDEVMQITVAFNHFGKRLIQRMPRCRFGFFHVVNNDYTHWVMYAIGGSQHPTIISRGNRFIAPPNPNAKEVTKREYAPYSVWKNWIWTSDEDIMLNGAFFNESGDKSKKFSFSNKDMIKPMDGSHVSYLTQFAGPLNCHEGKAC